MDYKLLYLKFAEFNKSILFGIYSLISELLAPRSGHRSIFYFGNILHIGGTGSLQVEKWDSLKSTKPQKTNSVLTLTDYTDWPEIFEVSKDFCK